MPIRLQPLCKQTYKGIQILLICLLGLLAVGLVGPLLDRLFRRYAEAGKNRIKVLWCRAVCRILRIRVTATSAWMAKPGLVVCNHVSWLDVVILGAQRPVTFVAKSEIQSWPVMGYLVRRIGTLFVVRGDRKQGQTVMERMTWLLRHGETVVIFPEGTTTDGSSLLRFHGRYYQAAMLTGQPVQAVAIRYQGAARNAAPFIGDDSFLPHLLRILRLNQIDVRLDFCTPITVHGNSRRNLADRTHTQIASRLETPTNSALPLCG